jgi:hypothetical protein
LHAYHGVLVSDFYSGYDAIPCKQQKRLVHLIRDIYDDLCGAPFDSELEGLALQMRTLFIQIFGAVDRYGLKQRHLHMFERNVERFYRAAIDGAIYTSEMANKYQQRILNAIGALSLPFLAKMVSRGTTIQPSKVFGALQYNERSPERSTNRLRLTTCG